MDWGPVMFTSDVSLPKDDKTAMRGKQITAEQLTGLKGTAMLIMLQRKEEAEKHGVRASFAPEGFGHCWTKQKWN